MNGWYVFKWFFTLVLLLIILNRYNFEQIIVRWVCRCFKQTLVVPGSSLLPADKYMLKVNNQALKTGVKYVCSYHVTCAF